MKVKPASLEEMSPAQLLHIYPNLTEKNYRKTSDATINYNCVSWVFGNKNEWKDFYLLPNYEYNEDLSCNDYIKHFSRNGFKLCNDGDYEKGKQKIALYENRAGEFTHVAMQLSETEWTSKLGEFEDIAHLGFESLEGTGHKDRCGKVLYFMERNADI